MNQNLNNIELKKIRRISLWGGPGSGKSTTAAWLFSELKQRDFSIEHVGEYVKKYAYENRKIDKFDQVYLFGHQQNTEYRYLKHGVKAIVTDSPTGLSTIYGGKFDKTLGEALWTLNELYDKEYPSINIFLDRKNRRYDPAGRWQSYEQAIAIDKEVRGFLEDKYKDNHIVFEYTDKAEILKYVIEQLSK